MIDIPSNDFGYIHPYCCPEPDSVLDLTWGTVMAKGVARITTYGYVDATMSGGSAIAQIATKCNDYNGPPLIAGYFHVGTVWSQAGEILPYGCSAWGANDFGDGLVMTFLGFKSVAGPNDQIRLQWGRSGNQAANSRGTAFTIMVYGQ
jgi:hypothetical protein